ncbi:MAG TPA: hypothetical protein DCY88_12105 [Cyanobacteria bacterium UBA11372]|nr:hypothetical protein [Cyanobacteria bacterium UBA11372]
MQRTSYYAHIPGFWQKSWVWQGEIDSETKVIALLCVCPTKDFQSS